MTTDMEDLRQEIATLRAELAAMRQQQAQPEDDEPVTRRGLFGKLAGAAVGGVGLATLAADPAAATVGTMQFGTGNNSDSDGTTLLSTSSAPTLDISQAGTGIALDVDVANPTGTATTFVAKNSGTGSVITAESLNNASAQPAVLGTHPTAIGVKGTSTSGNGVNGISTSGVGVVGSSTSSRGVQGSSDTSYGGWFSGGGAQLFLVPYETPGAPTTGAHSIGELVMDVEGVVWHCVGGGSPGTWAKAGFNVAGPARLLNGDTAAGLFTPGQTKDLTVVGFQGIPAVADAVAVSVSAKSNATGYVTLWPFGAPTRPAIAQVTFSGTGQWTASAIVPIGTDGKIRVFNSAGSTRIFVDVAGWFL